MGRRFLILFLLLPIFCNAQSTGSNLEEEYRTLSDIIDSYKIINAKDSLMYAALVERRGAIQSERGNLSSAANDYLSAIEHSEQDVGLRSKIALNASRLFMQMGMYGAAENLLTDISFDDSDNELVRIVNIGSCFILQEKYSEADSVYRTLLSRPDIADRHRGILYQNIGFAEYEQHKYTEAQACFESALEYLTGKDRLYVLGNLAMCKAYDNDYAGALSCIDNSLIGLSKLSGEKHPDYIAALRKKAEIKILYAKPEAVSAFKTYFAAERQWLLDNLFNLSSNLRLDLWIKEKDLLAKCFMLEERDADFLFEVAMFRRQTSLLGMRDTVNLKMMLGAEPGHLRSSLGNDEAVIEFVRYTDVKGNQTYAAIVLSKKGKTRFIKIFDEEDVYEPEVVGSNSIFNAVKREDKTELDLLYSNRELGNRIWRPVLSVLPGSVSKIYFAPEGILHIWGIENMPFDGMEQYDLYRVTSTASLINRTNSHASLSEKKKLIIGGLDYDNINDDSQRPSVGHYPDREAGNILRSYMGNGRRIFSYLKGSRTEADSVSVLLNATAQYEMSEADAKSLMPDYDLVHLATHGYSLNLGIRSRPEFLADSIPFDRSLLACGLAFSGANARTTFRQEDGVLSAREICDLDLRNVEFVVLSACQTAKGDITDEGAAGLVRGLKNAGVKTVLATLWSVNDRSTMLFMQEFYKRLEAGCSKYEAFRLAQSKLKNEPFVQYRRRFSPRTLARENKRSPYETKYSDPYYWAPFILIDAIE